MTDGHSTDEPVPQAEPNRLTWSTIETLFGKDWNQHVTQTKR
jgi:hypothetical protein